MELNIFSSKRFYRISIFLFVAVDIFHKVYAIEENKCCIDCLCCGCCNDKKIKREKRLALIDKAKDLNDLSYLSTEEIKNIYGDLKEKNKLGKGGYGNVYKVSPFFDKKSYAIKEMEIQSPSEKKQFFDEIKNQYTLANLSENSEYFVKIYDVFLSGEESDPKYCYIVMELCGKDTLWEKIPQGGITDPKIVASYFYQLVSAVNYMHFQKYVHRDLKPENILFDSNGKLKIADFGLSREATGDFNTPRKLLGTFPYIPPEKIYARNLQKHWKKQNIDWDIKLEDAYAIICILYIMIFRSFLVPVSQGEDYDFLTKYFKGEIKKIQKKGGKKSYLEIILSNIKTLNDDSKWHGVKNLFEEILAWEMLLQEGDAMNLINNTRTKRITIEKMMESNFFKFGEDCYNKKI